MFSFEEMPRGVFAVGRVGTGGVNLLGTAFALDKPGYFATASHVCGEDDNNLVLCFKPMAQLSEYQDTVDRAVKQFPVRISAYDPFHDLAVLKAEIQVVCRLPIRGADEAPVGTPVCIFGYPHADQGRMVLTQQNTDIGARVLIAAGAIKTKHLVLNIQARPGQSGGPVYRGGDGALVAIVVGSYAPGGGGGISLGGIDPHTLHQTTHAVSAEYLNEMY